MSILLLIQPQELKTGRGENFPLPDNVNATREETVSVLHTTIILICKKCLAHIRWLRNLTNEWMLQMGERMVVLFNERKNLMGAGRGITSPVLTVKISTESEIKEEVWLGMLIWNHRNQRYRYTWWDREHLQWEDGELRTDPGNYNIKGKKLQRDP